MFTAIELVDETNPEDLVSKVDESLAPGIKHSYDKPVESKGVREKASVLVTHKDRIQSDTDKPEESKGVRDKASVLAIDIDRIQSGTDKPEESIGVREQASVLVY